MKYISKCLFVFCVFFISKSTAQIYNLAEVYAFAKENDPVYLQALANANAQKEIKSQARSAILPSIALSATQSDISRSISEDSDAKNYSLSLQQNIFDKRAFTGLKQADAIFQKANIELQIAENDLILRVTEAYFNTLTAQDNLQSIAAKKNSVNEQLQQTQQRFEVGLVTNTELKEAEANFDLTIADEITAENTLSNQYQSLSDLTDTRVDGVAELSKNFPLVQTREKTLNEWLSLASEQNPSLQVALLDAETSKQALSLERSDRFPKLNASLARNYNEDSLLSPDGEYDTTLAISLSVPIYTGGSTSSKIRQAEFNYDASYQALILQRRQIESNTRQAYRNIQAAIGRSNAFAKAVESTTAALEATEAGYEFGTRTPADVLNAVDNVFDAENNFATARYNFIISYFQLLAAAGELTAADLAATNQWLN